MSVHIQALFTLFNLVRLFSPSACPVPSFHASTSCSGAYKTSSASTYLATASSVCCISSSVIPTSSQPLPGFRPPAHCSSGAEVDLPLSASKAGAAEQRGHARSRGILCRAPSCATPDLDFAPTASRGPRSPGRNAGPPRRARPGGRLALGAVISRHDPEWQARRREMPKGLRAIDEGEMISNQLCMSLTSGYNRTCSNKNCIGRDLIHPLFLLCLVVHANPRPSPPKK